jgi:hypothetical protein
MLAEEIRKHVNIMITLVGRLRERLVYTKPNGPLLRKGRRGETVRRAGPILNESPLDGQALCGELDYWLFDRFNRFFSRGRYRFRACRQTGVPGAVQLFLAAFFPAVDQM